VSRDTPALAFGVNYSVFKEPLPDRSGPHHDVSWGLQPSVGPTLTSAPNVSQRLATSRRERRPCQATRTHPGRAGDLMGRRPDLQANRGDASARLAWRVPGDRTRRRGATSRGGYCARPWVRAG
jgi:hypothetical protein